MIRTKKITILKMRAIVAFFLCIPALHAQTNVYKTFLSPQRELALKSAVDNAWLVKSYKKLSYKVDLQGVYTQSINGKAIGSYFGFNGSNAITIDPDPNNDLSDFPPSAFIHDPVAPATQTLKGNLSISPRRTIYGVRVNLMAIKQINDRNFFVQASVPFLQVTHDLNSVVTNETKMTTDDGKSIGILDYFEGSVTQEGLANPGDRKQKALTHGKYKSKQTKSGIGSLDLIVGMDACNNEHCDCTIKFCASIPLGNKATGEFLFEPIVGTGCHAEIGAGLDVSLHLYESESMDINLYSSAQVMYGLSAIEHRTIGTKNRETQTIPLWVQYSLGGEKGKPGVFPMANVLTLPLRVHPNARVSWMFDAVWSTEVFDFSVGYGVQGKEEETVRILSFDENRYALAAQDYDTTHNFMSFIGDNDTELMTLNDLNLIPAVVPAQFTHGIRASITFKRYDKNDDQWLAVKLGAGYDFTSNNASFEQYGVFAKLCCFF